MSKQLTLSADWESRWKSVCDKLPAALSGPLECPFGQDPQVWVPPLVDCETLRGMLNHPLVREALVCGKAPPPKFIVLFEDFLREPDEWGHDERVVVRAPGPTCEEKPRDELILELREQGRSCQAIAEAVGLTKSGVWWILNEQKKRGAA